MKKKANAKPTAKGKPKAAVLLKDVADSWPKPTQQGECRTDKRIWIACKRAKTDEKKRRNALRHLAEMPIPKRIKAAVEQLRECMAGDQLHDPVAVVSVAAFFLGVELQDQFPEFSRKIQPHTRATRANSKRAKAKKDYCEREFKWRRAKFPNRDKSLIIGDIKENRDHTLFPKWPCPNSVRRYFDGCD